MFLRIPPKTHRVLFLFQWLTEVGEKAALRARESVTAYERLSTGMVFYAGDAQAVFHGIQEESRRVYADTLKSVQKIIVCDETGTELFNRKRT